MKYSIQQILFLVVFYGCIFALPHRSAKVPAVSALLTNLGSHRTARLKLEKHLQIESRHCDYGSFSGIRSLQPTRSPILSLSAFLISSFLQEQPQSPQTKSKTKTRTPSSQAPGYVPRWLTRPHVSSPTRKCDRVMGSQAPRCLICLKPVRSSNPSERSRFRFSRFSEPPPCSFWA